MLQQAQTFDDWQDVFCFAPVGGELGQTALEKMAELARTVEEWCSVYCYAHKGGEVEEDVMRERE
jgi:hypothetical protein